MNFQWSKAAEQKMERYRTLMFEAERYLWAHPQTGFKEWEADAYLKERFKEMGFSLVEAGNIPGFYFDIDTGKEGPTVCVLGELDSIINFDHPECDPGTGAVHSCGHHCQVSALLGVAGVLADEEILSGLCGKIRIMAVPAEELLELSERKKMKAEGRIRYFSGKTEFMSRGYFDDVDLAFMIHTSRGEKPSLSMTNGYNGALAKTVTYHGRAAHAAGCPWDGVNALYAAQTAISSINALRETFRDEYRIRTHPIITSGGSMVNNIPSETVIETYVRATDFLVLRETNERINRAFAAGALAFGAQVEIDDLDIYMPEYHDPGLCQLMCEVGADILGEEQVSYNPREWNNGSSDMGNLSTVMPIVQPASSGAVGIGHGDNYYITSPELAVFQPAVIQAAAVCALLEKGGARAKKIVQDYNPVFSSIREYFEAVDRLCKARKPVVYTEDGGAKVTWN